MSASTVRADYDELRKLTQSFQQQAEATGQSIAAVRKSFEALRDGDWQGEGARAFFAEMDSDVMPTMTRLHKALQSGATVTGQIGQAIKQAEDEAANVLKGTGGAAAGAAAGGAAGAAAGGGGGGAAGGGAAGGGGGGAAGGGGAGAPGGAGAAGGGAAGGAGAGGGGAPPRPDPTADTTEQMLGDLPEGVRDIAQQSPTMKAQLEALQREGWTIKSGAAGGGSFADRDNKTITINSGDADNVTAGGLAHELGHASTPEPPFIAPTPGMARQDFIDQNVQQQLLNEGEAQFNAAQARSEIGAAGGPDTGIPGTQTAANQAIFDDFSAGNITRAEAVEQMAGLMGNETTSNTGENYRQYYGHSYEKYWDTNVAPPGGTP